NAARFANLFLRLERFAPLAIQALVRSFVNVSVVVDLLNKLAATLKVARLAGLDEVVVADLQSPPDVAELPGHVVAVFLGIAAQLRGFLSNLDCVLVVADQEMDLEALHAAIASLHVGADLFERRADMWPAVRIIDRGSLKKTRRVGHGGVL